MSAAEPVTLADLYAASRSNRIRWEGQAVFGMVTVTVEPSFRVRFVESVPDPPQGVRLSAKRPMEVLGVTSTAFALWHEDADEFEVALRGRKPRQVRISTVWRSPRGSIQTWIGNYGMLLRREGGSVDFRCSDGRGEPSFDDLHFVVDGVLDTEPTD